MTATPARLELENVSAGYNGILALDHLTFQVPHGGQVAIVGPNGAGKSTLFKLLVGLLPVQTGRVRIHGEPLGQHQDCVAYIPQREEVDWRFPVTVWDVVMMGRYGRLGWLNKPGRADVEAVQNAIHQMDIVDLTRSPIADLSGGQQQRVFLARALAQEPHILLMDEPFTGVDFTTQQATLELIDQLQEKQVTVLVSTHDLNMASQRFDQVLLLNKQLISFGLPHQAITHQTIRKAFGERVHFLEGIAVIDECCPPEEN